MPPPTKAMGFCYFKSMAVALQGLTDLGLARKIAVLDLDCHHGNGTEAFCFGKDSFLYVSLHQFPAYPGTGQQSFGNCLNYPLSPETGEGDYFPVLEKALQKVRDFKPDLLGISMGFDTYEKDPLTRFGLKGPDYRTLGRMMKEMKMPQFALLEGGYHGDLPLLVGNFFNRVDRVKFWTASADQVNCLNMGLMLLSAGLAFRFPFELFIFSYTVLGPLHYLTEISWLKDRHFYTQGKYDYLVLVAAGALVTALTFEWLGPSPKGLEEFLVCAAFLSAFCFAVFKKPLIRLAAFPPVLGLSLLLSLSTFFIPLFGVFLPTLIHVFIFTGLFIWAGALRSKSFSGALSLAVFVSLAGFLLFFQGSGHLTAGALMLGEIMEPLGKTASPPIPLSALISWLCKAWGCINSPNLRGLWVILWPPSINIFIKIPWRWPSWLSSLTPTLTTTSIGFPKRRSSAGMRCPKNA